MTYRMRGRALLASTGAAATALVGNVLFASPASAHAPSAWHGSDYVYVDTHGYGAEHGSYNHDHIVVTDQECDGHLVWADFRYYGESEYNRIADDNPGSSGCALPGKGFIDQYYRDIYQFRVCEDSEGCSAWQYTTSGGGK